MQQPVEGEEGGVRVGEAGGEVVGGRMRSLFPLASQPQVGANPTCTCCQINVNLIKDQCPAIQFQLNVKNKACRSK